MIPYPLKRLAKTYQHVILSAYRTGTSASLRDVVEGRQGRRYRDNNLIKNYEAHQLTQWAGNRMIELAQEIEEKLEAIREGG